MSFGAGEVLKKTPSGILHLFHSPCKHEVNESFSAVRSYHKAAGRLAYMTLGSPEGSTLTVDDFDDWQRVLGFLQDLCVGPGRARMAWAFGLLP